MEYPKPKLQGDSFVQDFETNDAETEFFIKLKKASCMNSAIKEILTARRGRRNDKGTSKTTLIFPKIYKAGELDGQGSFSYARLLAISVHMKKVLEKAGLVFPALFIFDLVQNIFLHRCIFLSVTALITGLASCMCHRNGTIGKEGSWKPPHKVNFPGKILKPYLWFLLSLKSKCYAGVLYVIKFFLS